MSTTYDLFARKEYPEPLTYIGSVVVEDADDVVRISLESYGPESNWVEMVAVPRQQVIMVFSEHKEKSL